MESCGHKEMSKRPHASEDVLNEKTSGLKVAKL